MLQFRSVSDGYLAILENVTALDTDRVMAVLFGLALGDALGAPTEFMSLDGIRTCYGAQGIMEPPNPALFTDDTQMTLALAEGIVSCETDDLDSIMRAVGRRFVEWLNSPENNRAPGLTCLDGVRRFEAGEGWREAGSVGSKGCGSAMRVAPIGVLYQDDPDRLRQVAEASSLITHRHPAAVAASIGAAYLVKLALDGVEPDSYLSKLAAATMGMCDDYDRALLRVGHVLGWGDEIAAMRHIGEGWVGEEALALALYCVTRYPDDYVGAVRRGANSNGDSDSVACIAGGVSAARLGLAAIPANWIDRCEKRDYIAELSARLAARREAYSRSSDGL
jgi:ADP-ribosylglycohydrolase